MAEALFRDVSLEGLRGVSALGLASAELRLPDGADLAIGGTSSEKLRRPMGEAIGGVILDLLPLSIEKPSLLSVLDPRCLAPAGDASIGGVMLDLRCRALAGDASALDSGGGFGNWPNANGLRAGSSCADLLPDAPRDLDLLEAREAWLFSLASSSSSESDAGEAAVTILLKLFCCGSDVSLRACCRTLHILPDSQWPCTGLVIRFCPRMQYGRVFLSL